MRKHSKKKIAGIVAGVFLIGCFVIYVSRHVWLPWMGSILVRNDATPAKADAIVMLLGDHNSRPVKVAELLRSEIAPRVVFVPCLETPAEELGVIPHQAELSARMLMKNGVPRDKIETTKGCATSTFEEAISLREHFLQNPPKPVHLVFVTHWFHTTRASWILRKTFEGTPITFNMVSVTAPRSSPVEWWKSEEAFLQVFTEYLKWAYYVKNYGFRPVEARPWSCNWDLAKQ